MDIILPRMIVQMAPRAMSRTPLTNAFHSFNAYRHSTTKSRFSTTTPRYVTLEPKNDPYTTHDAQGSSYTQAAANLSQEVSQEETNHFEHIEEQSKEKQRTSPWTRQGSDIPPVARDRSAGAMTKGKLLTTPSRMLKFIIPLTPNDRNGDRKDIEPLALLVHPQQPLSYLERLIQSELPVLEDGKPPSVVFRAEDAGQEGEKSNEERDAENQDDGEEAEHKTRIDGKLMKTGKLNSKHDDISQAKDEVVDPKHPNFVRWSTSTEIGDFIRDAARAKEFALDVEGAGTIYVGVPSFADRTYYLRMRLRKTGQKILQQADLKRECDTLAHKGAKQVAKLGFVVLISWWVAVYYFTFQTSLGWDTLEPVTYLVGLSSLIGGYMWFLYHNREVSYRSAMHFTISRRQTQLYEQKGFDIHKWEFLVDEGNRLRREIKMIADEYDVEWDETQDEGHKKVAQALREERKKEKEKNKDKDDEDSEEDDDDNNQKSDKDEK